MSPRISWAVIFPRYLAAPHASGWMFLRSGFSAFWAAASIAAFHIASAWPSGLLGQVSQLITPQRSLWQAKQCRVLMSEQVIVATFSCRHIQSPAFLRDIQFQSFDPGPLVPHPARQQSAGRDLGEREAGADQARGVDVVAARVRDAGHGALPRVGDLVVDRQRVEVGAQRHQPATVADADAVTR